MTAKILAFDGSARNGSMNHKLLEIVSAEAKANGASVTTLDLSAYDLPIYNGDVESEGMPEGVQKLKDIFSEHDAFLIASPEYNGSYSPLLKNVIDWVSRPVNGVSGLSAFKGKPAGIMSAAPGKMGGLRGIYQLNTLLFICGAMVLPEIVSVGFAKDAFDDAGALKNDPDKNAVARLAQRLVHITQSIKE